MRKVYLLITAALLLISSGAWAGNQAKVGDKEYATIGEAITNWTSSTTLTILEDCEYSTGATDVSVSKKLDLNGHTFTWVTSYKYALWLDSGAILTVEDNSDNGKGRFEILVDASVESALGIVLGYPIGGVDTNGTLVARNCTLSFSSPNATVGEFIVNQYNSIVELFNCTVDVNSEFFLINQYGDANIDDCTINASAAGIYHRRGNVNLSGNTKILANGDNNNAIGVSGSGEDVADYSVLSIDENATVSAPNGNGICIFGYNYSTTPDCYNAYGVKVDLKGKLYAKVYGISTNGMIKGTGVNVPKINIASTSEIKNLSDEEWIDESKSCGNKVIKGMYCGIYAAGYAEWNIKGNITASTPIYSKSGTIRVDGAKIHAIGNYYEPLAYGNGACTTGDAIIMDSHKSYPGNIILQVVGNSEIVSDNGYAVQEALTYMPTSKSIELTLENSSFAGAKGTVTLSDDFRKALVDGMSEQGEWKLNGVTSGKYTAKPEVVKDGYEIVEVSGQYPFLYEVKAKTSTSYTEVSLDADQDAYTVENGYELVVKNGKTLNIGTLTIGTDENYPSRVRVQPGGTLVVGSIVMNNSKGAESLLLESDGNGTGKLLFNSDNIVTTLGTVELFAQCRVLDADNKVYLFQHIGIPMYPIGGSIEKEVATAYAQWNVRSGWYYTNSESVINQGIWSGSNVTTNTPNAGSVFKFKGELLGNNDAEFLFAGDDCGYKCLANSYTAPMSMVELIDAYKTINGADGTVWVYKASDYEKKGKNFVQWNKVDAVDENAAIDPMQAFFVLHKATTEDSFTVDYNDAVYNYNKGINASIKAGDAVTVENKGKISIFDGESTATLSLYEGEGLSDAFDMDYDGYQMETGNIQIYVGYAGEKWSSFATNKLDGKEIVIVSKANTEITMSFSKLGGNAFKLTDIASGADVEVSEENTYRFTIAPNSTTVRFRLSEGEVSADEADADAVKVWVAENVLNIAGAAEGDSIEIINLAGIKVLSATATGEAVQSISLSSIAGGAYIVKAGSATVKVIK